MDERRNETHEREAAPAYTFTSSRGSGIFTDTASGHREVHIGVIGQQALNVFADNSTFSRRGISTDLVSGNTLYSQQDIKSLGTTYLANGQLVLLL